MKKSRFSTDQVGILKEQETGVNPLDLARKHGISRDTIYRWKATYGGMDPSDERRLKELEDENRRLKQVVADLTLHNQALKAVLGKNRGEAPARRSAVGFVRETFEINERGACGRWGSASRGAGTSR